MDFEVEADPKKYSNPFQEYYTRVNRILDLHKKCMIPHLIDIKLLKIPVEFLSTVFRTAGFILFDDAFKRDCTSLPSECKSGEILTVSFGDIVGCMFISSLSTSDNTV